MILQKQDAAVTIGPGDHIEEMMEDQGWTQQDLADVLGVSLKHVNKLLNNEQPITLEMAKNLSEAFGPGPEFWINTDTNYRLKKEKQEDNNNDSVSIRSAIYKHMPLGELFRKGWLRKTDDPEKLKNLVCDFWGIDELDFSFMENVELIPEFRKSEAYSRFSHNAALTWFQMARNVAEDYKVETYHKEKLASLAGSIPEFTTANDGINTFLKELNKAGVMFFVLEHLQKTYLDGASFMKKDNPVIVYTGRYNRNDHFWFTVAHEIAHVLLHIRNEDHYFIDDAKVNEQSTNKKEEEANTQAAEWLRQPDILRFFEGKMKYIKQRDIDQCAHELNIHPGIVVGTLAFSGKMSYRHLHRNSVKVLNHISVNFKYEPD